MNDAFRARLLRLKEEVDHVIGLVDDGQILPMERNSTTATKTQDRIKLMPGQAWYRLPSFEIVDYNPRNEPDPVFVPLPQNGPDPV